MKTNIIKRSFWAVTGLFMLLSCEPQEDEKIDLGPMPVLTSDDYKIEVTRNIVKFTFLADKSTPIWFLTENTVSTEREFTFSYLWKGNYTVKLKKYNKAGISDSILIPIAIESTDPYICSNEDYTNLTGGCAAANGKTWIWDQTVSGHMGCGPSEKNIPEWWAAGPNEKVGVGLYDDELTFLLNLNQDFIHKTNGDVYVNADAATTFDPLHYTTKPSADVIVAYTPPTQKWNLTESNGVKYITFSTGGFPSYVSNPAALAVGAKYKILTLSATELYLQLQAPGINWYFKFKPKP